MSESIKGLAGRSLAFSEIFDTAKEVQDMTEQEVRDNLTTFRTWLTWLPPEIIYWGSKIGEQIRIAERSGTMKSGNYVGFVCEITNHKIEGFDRVYNNVQKKFFIERSTSIIPQSNIVDFGFISESVEVEDD